MYICVCRTFTGVEMVDEITTETVSNAALYGLFQERHIQLMKSSPYWTAEAEEKVVFVIGGWAVQNGGPEGYGQLAARYSPSSSMITIAGYNGGWERSQVSSDTREGFMSALMLNAVILNEEADRLTRTQEQLREMGIDVMLGTYEAGPGYNLDGLNGVVMTPAQVESESLVLKSQAGGVATLETFLYRARLGWDMQNFFTFDRNRHYWVSHARKISGGYAYPPWSALTMYNKYAVGTFLIANTVSSPAMDFEGNQDVPLVVVYATKSEDGSRYNVFVISRKLDNFPYYEDRGFSNVSVALPFHSAQSIRLVKMDSSTGPTTTTLDSNAVVVEEEDITMDAPLLIPLFQVSMPPGAAYLYVFSGVQMWDVPSSRTIMIAPVRGVVSYPDVTVKFKVVCDRPWDDFSLSDLSISGTAQGSLDGTTFQEDSWSKRTSFIVSVTDMRSAGTVILSIGQVSSEVLFAVQPEIPTAPVNVWVDVDEESNTADFHWRVQADIAQYPASYVLQWGTSPDAITEFSSGELVAHDNCPRCHVCPMNPSIFCSEASISLNLSNIYPPDTTTYQSRYPVYFQVKAVTAAGSSAPSFVTIYQIIEDFDLLISGADVLPVSWRCTSNCGGLGIVNGSTSTVISPTSTPLLQFMQHGITTVLYKQDNAGVVDDELLPFQFYTMSINFGFRLPAGTSELGILTHYSNDANWIIVFVNPGAGTFRIIGRRYNSPVYASIINLTPISPAITEPTGQVWRLTVQVRPAQMYCGSAQEVLVRIEDENGVCRIDVDSINGAVYQASTCVIGFSHCSLDGLAGTIGLYSNNAQAVEGHFVDSVSVTAVSLVP